MPLARGSARCYSFPMKSLAHSLQRLNDPKAVEQDRLDRERAQQQRDARGAREKEGLKQVWESDVIAQSGGFTVAATHEGWLMAARLRRKGRGLVIDEIRLRPADGMPGWHLTSSDQGEGRELRAKIDDAFWGPYQIEGLWSDELGACVDDVIIDEDDGHETPGKGISATLIRNLPWTQLLQMCRHSAVIAAESNDVLNEWTDHELPDVDTIKGAVVRPGRAGRDDLFYAQIARTYLELIEEGDLSPIDTIAVREQYSRDTVAGWIKTARKRRLLSGPPGRRVAGGELTDKAKEALASQGNEEGAN